MIDKAALTAALILSSFGLAHGADRTAGLQSARRLCVNCHVVEPDTAKQTTLTAGIPSFRAIADKYGQTDATVKARMLNPHPPMPQVQLTTHELDNLASYIMSLKGTQ